MLQCGSDVSSQTRREAPRFVLFVLWKSFVARLTYCFTARTSQQPIPRDITLLLQGQQIYLVANFSFDSLDTALLLAPVFGRIK